MIHKISAIDNQLDALIDNSVKLRYCIFLSSRTLEMKPSPVLQLASSHANGLTCILLLTPVVSMREAMLTVSPQMSYCGFCEPITPAITGPWFIPVRHTHAPSFKHNFNVHTHAQLACTGTERTSCGLTYAKAELCKRVVD